MIEADKSDHTLEQTQETAQPPTVVEREELADAHHAANELLLALARIPDGDLISDMVSNAIKLLRDRTNRGDLKLVNTSFKELRYALKIFAPYRDVRKVSIFGSARTHDDHADYQQAAEYARRMVAAGWMVITGAGGGIMAAGHGGAGADPSFGLAIRLPFEQATNTHIANDPKLINFKYFFTRKLIFVRSSHAIALFPGGFGTMDEGFEVLTLIQTGKCPPMPIVCVDTPGSDYWKSWREYVCTHLLARGLINEDDLCLFRIVHTPEDAVREVTHFYSNFHSIRYVRDELVIRLQRAPSAEQLAQIEQRFGDLKIKGAYRVTGPLSVERDEPTLANLPRLAFNFNRRDHGRLRQMIDYLNDLPGKATDAQIASPAQIAVPDAAL
jgi:uncharacterized protein (TIGR00730 family)